MWYRMSRPTFQYSVSHRSTSSTLTSLRYAKACFQMARGRYSKRPWSSATRKIHG